MKHYGRVIDDSTSPTLQNAQDLPRDSLPGVYMTTADAYERTYKQRIMEIEGKDYSKKFFLTSLSVDQLGEGGNKLRRWRHLEKLGFCGC